MKDIFGDLLYFLNLCGIYQKDLKSDEFNDFISSEVFSVEQDSKVQISQLVNPFTTIDENLKESYFFPVEYGKYVFNDEKRDFSKEIQNLISEFKKEISALPMNFNIVERLVKKYFSFVSFSKPFIQSISAYQYSKLQALLSSSLRLYCQNYGKNLGSLQNAEQIFTLVGGDISGIQRFISNVSSRGALRSYRGRSFFIEFVQEVIVDKILEDIGLSRLHVYFIGGGHFYLIVPNISEIEQKMNKSIEEINRWFIEKRLDLSVIIDYTHFSLNEVKHDIQKVFSELSKKLRLKKYRSLSIENMPMVFEPLTLSNLEVCKVCGRKVEKVYKLRNDDIEAFACEICKMQYEFGKEIMESENVYIIESAQGSFEILGKRFDFVQNFEGNRKGYKIRKINEILEKEENIIPLEIVSYAYSQDLSELSVDEPSKKYASFQADVDNLGNLFRNKLGNTSLAQSSMISGMLTYFFKQQIYKILAGKKITVIYAGGDDLFLLGNWRDVLEFSKQMYEEFRNFVQNENITFSAGYVLFSDKESIKMIKEISENAESRAKDNGKDSIAFSNPIYKGMVISGQRKHVSKGLALKWREYQEIFDFFEDTEEIADYVDRSLIRKMLNISYENTPLAHAYFSYLYARETEERDKELIGLIMEKYKNLDEKSLEKVNARMNLIAQLLDLTVRR